jgi:hypothetical protein
MRFIFKKPQGDVPKDECPSLASWYETRFLRLVMRVGER